MQQENTLAGKTCQRSTYTGSQWCRLHKTALTSYKIQQMQDAPFRFWIGCLLLGTGRDGYLPSIEQMAFDLRLSIGHAKAYLDEMIMLGLVDIQPDRRLRIHDWDAHQFRPDISRDRTRKYRERKQALRNGDGVVTRHVTEFASESESVSASESNTNGSKLGEDVQRYQEEKTLSGVRTPRDTHVGTGTRNAYARVKGGEA